MFLQKNKIPVAPWTFTACQMPCTRLCKGHYWTVWGFLEHQYLPFWPFIFLLNVNHDASGRETSCYIYFYPTLNLSFHSFPPSCIFHFYTALLRGALLYKAFGDFFPWFSLCKYNRHRPRVSDILVQYRGVYQVLLPATQLTVAIRQPRCDYEAHTCWACIFLCCRTQ